MRVHVKDEFVERHEELLLRWQADRAAFSREVSLGRMTMSSLMS